MANIALVLKEEITRLARKELRGQTAQLKKVSAQYRTEIAALKRRISALEKQVPKSARGSNKQEKIEPASEVVKGTRFSAQGLRTLRARLDLSAKDFAKLIGVSDQSVNKWEAERATPRAAQLASIAAVRKIGKRDALAKLAAAS